MKKKTTKGRPSKYTEKMAVDIYIHAKSGMSNHAIANTLGVSVVQFAEWIKKHEAVKYALELGRGSTGSERTTSFKDYVYNKLSPELQDLWDRIELWADHPNGLMRIEELLAPYGTRVRQSLWMHAMVQNNFNASEACRVLGMSKEVIQSWADSDPNFPKLLDELNYHKKNFFEGSLIKLVQHGNTLATIFANKTHNRDRGYGEKIKVEHTGTVTNLHLHVISIDKLKLPMDVRVQLLSAIREAKQVGVIEEVEEMDDEVEGTPKALELAKDDIAGDSEDDNL